MATSERRPTGASPPAERSSREDRTVVDRSAPAPPFPSWSAIDPSPRESVGERIGPYRILERIGDGGMGVVYIAEQKEPVERRVALKVIKRGMDTDEVLARFELEHHALAMMNHPGVARVFDAGATADGRPYFVMEYVPGVSITDYCNRHHLSTDERLELFLKVCHAVQHAHQKGVIHRDLKPSNILVMVQDGKPAPKIIDFGVAKATGRRFTERTLYTELGQIIGTPEYMSPEQAEMTGHDIDTRSDVYSLGAILYKLLCGTLPFDSKTLRSAGHAQIQRIIREQEIHRPSTRLSSLGDSARRNAERQRADPRALIRRLRGDLDWITLKALEKDRTRRYDSVSELAADLERHLRDEPVTAGPPSAVYRLSKLVRRHRGAFATLLAVLGALAAGMVASMLLYLDADEARGASDEARLVAEAARGRERSARELSEARYEELLRLSDVKRLTDLRRRALGLWPAHPEKIPAMQTWLQEAYALAGRLAAHRETLERLRRQALPYRGEEEERDRETHPWSDDLEEMRALKERTLRELSGRMAAGDPAAGGAERAEELEGLLEELAARMPRVEEEVARRRTWRFGDTELQWQHDTLMELVSWLEAFLDADPRVGEIADVERRLGFARTVIRRSLEEPRQAWVRAISSIADREECPLYDGLELEPQLGLVPVGRDPHSGLWEFGHLQTGEIPRRDRGGRLVITEETGLVFVLIPGGVFWMGAVASEEESADSGGAAIDAHAEEQEGPAHPVTLAPFFLSKQEMTQGQWLRVTGRNPSLYRPGSRIGGISHSLTHPVEQVSWKECERVLGRLGLLLPTEAQWEYAARGGTGTVWWTGDEPESLAGACNLRDRFCKENGAPAAWSYDEWLDDGFVAHAPVGSYRANPFGLHDVTGNVWEWCRDWFASYERPVNEADGERRTGPTRGRVNRGGSWSTPALRARTALRFRNAPTFRGSNLGLRPARSVD